MRKPLLTLFFAAAASAQTLPPATVPTASISGTVRDAGTGIPIPEATVNTSLGRYGPQSATTDEQGRFTLRDLAAGQHRITARTRPDGGFGTYATRLVTIVAPGQEVKPVDFALRMHGEISGRVVDQNNEPAPDMWVFLIAREYSLGALRYVYAALSRTNDLGEYALRRVAPGRAYLLMAAKRTMKLDAISESPADPKLRRPAVVPTYYPGTPSFEGAQHLVLRTGERREGVDIRLLRSSAHCIEGILQGPNGPEPLSFQIGDRRPASGASGDGAMFVATPSGITGPDGKIRICDLYPGEYQLAAHSKPGSGMPAFYGTAIITVTDGDVRNFSIAASPRLQVPGEVVWDGIPPDPPSSANLTVSLRPMTRAPWSEERASGKSSIPGQFSLENILVDEYSVQIRGVPSDAYIKDVTYAGRSILHETLRPGSAIGDAALRISLSRDGGTIAVKTVDKDGKPVADARVLVIPAPVPSEAALAASIVIGQTDQNGTWTSAPLAPGKYYVSARPAPPDKSPESIGNLWRDRHQAKEAEIGPNENLELTIEPVSID